jgi:hypothetical protein
MLSNVFQHNPSHLGGLKSWATKRLRYLRREHLNHCRKVAHLYTVDQTADVHEAISLRFSEGFLFNAQFF